jgi:hypothetical protein
MNVRPNRVAWRIAVPAHTTCLAEAAARLHLGAAVMEAGAAYGQGGGGHNSPRG